MAVQSQARRRARLGAIAGGTAAVAAMVTTVMITGPVAADTVNRYTVRANSPKPEACDNHGTIPAGTWLQNKPCGYFVGTAMAGSSFDVHETTANDYHYGRSLGHNDICGWIPPGALSGSPTGTAPASCGAATKERLSHRRTFGRDFNAPPHAQTDGSPITVDTGCQTYFNYYTSSDYAAGTLRDPAGAPGAEVRYRFTTNGADPAMVVRDEVRGWVFMDRDCVTDWRDVDFDEDDD
jgi:hypothetical protein